MTLFSVWEDMLSESFRPLGYCRASALKQRRHGEATESWAARAACTVGRKPSQERATAAPGISQKSALPPDTFSQVSPLVPQVIFSTQPHNTGATKKNRAFAEPVFYLLMFSHIQLQDAVRLLLGNNYKSIYIYSKICIYILVKL